MIQKKRGEGEGEKYITHNRYVEVIARFVFNEFLYREKRPFATAREFLSDHVKPEKDALIAVMSEKFDILHIIVC